MRGAFRVIAGPLPFSMALFAVVTVSSATPIQWQISDGGNDHYYEFVAAQAITFDLAKSRAAAARSTASPAISRQ